MQFPSPPDCTFLPRPAASSPGRAVCCSGSHQMSAGHWVIGLSLCLNPLDWTPQWNREPEPEEPPLCPTTHIQKSWNSTTANIYTCKMHLPPTTLFIFSASHLMVIYWSSIENHCTNYFFNTFVVLTFLFFVAAAVSMEMKKIFNISNSVRQLK